MKSFTQTIHAFFFILIILITVACSNNLQSQNRKITSNELDTGDPLEIQTTDSLFEISELIADEKLPQLRIIGKESGDIGRICGQKSKLPSGEDSNCLCSYTSSDGKRSWSFPSTYYESDLLICPLNQTDVEFKIRIINTESGKRGNDYSVTLNTPSTLEFNPLSFNPIQRFQCRPKIFIPNPFCNARNSDSQSKSRCTLDPIQSESLHLTYPVNYFTSNPFLSIRSLQESYTNPTSESQYWDCDMNLSATSQNKWINPNIYYKEKLIYPRASSVEYDHQTFYLSRSRSGLFSQAIISGVHPLNLLPKGEDEGDPRQTDIIGYAAPSFLSGGKHLCPTQVAPPENWEWVLVWVLINPTMPERLYSKESLILDPIIRLHRLNGGITCYADYTSNSTLTMGSSCKSVTNSSSSSKLGRRFFHSYEDAITGGTINNKPGSCFLVDRNMSAIRDQWSSYTQGGAASFPFINGTDSTQFPTENYSASEKNMNFDRHPFFYDDYLFLVTPTDPRTQLSGYHEIKLETYKHIRLCNADKTNCEKLTYSYSERQSGTRLHDEKVSPFCTMRPRQ